MIAWESEEWFRIFSERQLCNKKSSASRYFAENSLNMRNIGMNTVWKSEAFKKLLHYLMEKIARKNKLKSPDFADLIYFINGVIFATNSMVIVVKIEFSHS